MTGTSQPSLPSEERESKPDLRRRLRAARRGLATAYVEEADRLLADAVSALPELRGAEVVAAYASIGNEPPTRALLAALTGAGKRVLLPVTRPDLDLEWAEYAGPDSLQATPRGLLEPTGPSGPALGREGIALADLVLAPAQAVSVTGQRLGQGGGCYDRALARLRPGVPVFALVYDDEVLADLPAEPHDLPVTAALTPTRVLRFPAHP